MFKVIGGLVVAVLGGGFAEEHGLLVEEDVAAARAQAQAEVALVLRHH